MSLRHSLQGFVVGVSSYFMREVIAFIGKTTDLGTHSNEEASNAGYDRLKRT